MKLKDSTINMRVVKTTLSEDEWQKIVIAAVAKEANLTLGHGVSARAYVSTRDTSYGILKEIEVEISVDYTALPTPVGG